LRPQSLLPYHQDTIYAAWVAAQENAKTLLFDRGMEAADDAVAGVAPLGGLVVGAEDEFAGTTGGAEQGRRGLRQKVQVGASLFGRTRRG
jgi:hypothetical protein